MFEVQLEWLQGQTFDSAVDLFLPPLKSILNLAYSFEQDTLNILEKETLQESDENRELSKALSTRRQSIMKFLNEAI